MPNPMHRSERPTILPRGYANREWFTAWRIADDREAHVIREHWTGDPWTPAYPASVSLIPRPF